MNYDPLALQSRELPRFLRDLLASPPAAGTGLHQWIFRVACVLKPWRSDMDSAALIAAASTGSGRDLTREISEAVAHARNDWQPGNSSSRSPLLKPPRPAPSWPARDLDAIAAIAAGGAGIADLLEASPVRIEEDGPGAEDIVDLLFPGNPLLCVATHPPDARTLPREEWRGSLANHSLIVPSPMKDPTGTNKEGKTSSRCLDNTGPRRFLVVEFDFKAATPDGQPTPEAPLLARLESEGRTVQDLCAALLLHLMQFAPLLMAVHSGGKSLHGWFPAAGIPDDTLRSFFALAVRLGADPSTWTPCQLVRLPEGLRDNGQRQSVRFLDVPAIQSIPATITP